MSRYSCGNAVDLFPAVLSTTAIFFRMLSLAVGYPRALLLISVEEISAVSGMERTIPILAEMPEIVSSEIKAVENM